MHSRIFSLALVLLAAMLLATTLQAQTISYQDRLYYTCRVWGLLKYHHSAVSTCEVDWDAALLDVLPSIKAVESQSGFNDILIGLVQAAGPMAPPVGGMPQVPEQCILSRDLDWLADDALRDDVRDSLQVVVDNFRPHALCNARRNPAVGSWLDFPGDSPTLSLAVMNDMPDESQRLLCMFTYWNMLAWFNPNSKILEQPWDSTLHRNIMDVVNAQDARAFYDTYRHMASGLNDAHVNGYIQWTAEKYDVYGLKILLGWTSDGYTVLKSDLPEIAVGYILTQVDGSAIEDLEEEAGRVMSYGNPAVFRRDFAAAVLKGVYYDPIELGLENRERGAYNYAGKRDYAMNSSWHYSYYPIDSLADVTWKVLSGDVGYVNMGNLDTDEIEAMYNDLRELPAIIFDVRNYPRGTAPYIAGWMFPMKLPGNPYDYKGQVYILCDANSQSHAEWSCMVLGAMPGSVIVGSQTAGADGNVSGWQLTWDITAGFTSLGVYWPDGRQTQRIGIVPDYEVIPTRDDIIVGRDPVLIKALQLAGVTVGAASPALPPGLTLEQNYPNPFNPTTTIRFCVPSEGHVRLYITDALGRQQRTMFDAWVGSGVHTVDFDAGDLPSGTYSYSLETRHGILTKTMTVVK